MKTEKDTESTNYELFSFSFMFLFLVHFFKNLIWSAHKLILKSRHIDEPGRGKEKKRKKRI